MPRALNLITEEGALRQWCSIVRAFVRDTIIFPIYLAQQHAIIFLRAHLDFFALSIE
jgi:hypothetical protein